MALVSTGFSIGIVKLSKGQAIQKSGMIPYAFKFYSGATARSCMLKDGKGNEVWRAWGNEIFFIGEDGVRKTFDKLTVGLNLAASSWVYVYLR